MAWTIDTEPILADTGDIREVLLTTLRKDIQDEIAELDQHPLATTPGTKPKRVLDQLREIQGMLATPSSS